MHSDVNLDLYLELRDFKFACPCQCLQVRDGRLNGAQTLKQTFSEAYQLFIVIS